MVGSIMEPLENEKILIESDTKEHSNSKVSKENIINALVSALFLIFVNLFVMPFNIWVGAVKRLSKLREAGLSSQMQKTEFVVFNWLKLLFDSLIFLVYFIAPLVFVIGMIASLSNSYAVNNWGLAVLGNISSLVLFYFFPLFLSLIKEILAIALVQVMKIEQIEENTRK